MSKMITDYNFETDDVGNGFDLVLTVRGIKASLVTKGLGVAFKKYQVGTSKQADELFQGLESFKAPEKVFPLVLKAFANPFKRVRKKLEQKYDIQFLKWNVKACIFAKNKQDESELISIVSFRGDYKCI